MSILKRFFKDTIIYGIAIVLPRVINFLLVGLHTDVLDNKSYSDNTLFYVYAAFFNVLLTYGMETTFFRFFNTQKNQKNVLSTALTILTITTITFGVIVYTSATAIAEFMLIDVIAFKLLVIVTFLETLIVIPFAYLRVTGRPIRFAMIKLMNVCIFVLFNVLFLSETWGSKPLQALIEVDNKVTYIFIANLIATTAMFIFMMPYFFKVSFRLDKVLLKKMLAYGFPIMISGIAFVINENLDKWLLPRLESKEINGAYAACYKLAVFMTLFIQAFRMGAEPFFFNHAKEENAKDTYATILKYFTIVGCLGLISVVVFLDLITSFLIRSESYLIALEIVPYVLLANLCLGIYHNLSVWYKLTDKTKYGMYISIVGATITIILNITLIPVIGFMACAYATLAAYGGMMLLSYIIGKKHYNVPYEVKKIVGYLIIATIFSLTYFYLPNRNYAIGITEILLFLLIVIVSEKNELKRLLKK